jgi:hypothetical protein
MQIINVIQQIDGTIYSIHSFTITGGNEEEKQIVVEQAEKLFIEIINKTFDEPLEKEDEIFYLEEAYFNDDSGLEVSLVWSTDVTEQTLN